MSEYVIGLSKADEVNAMPGIELRAGALFSADDLAPELASETTSHSVYRRAQREARLIVARDVGERVVGFAHLVWVGGIAHLEEVDVEPDFARKGIGKLLVLASCDWARAHGSDRITLSTFRDVAWNAPFYARLGFAEIFERDLSIDLRRLRQREAREGLDLNKRVMMRRMLSDHGPEGNIFAD
jgi:GNAT superfamily N-acetyltransferase